MEFRIQELRKQRKLSRSKLAKLAGVSPYTIERLEQGAAKDAWVSTLRLIAKALEVPVDALFAEESRE